MVQPGNSPHTYEPKPSQMVEITKADLYFAIDVEFEHVWLPKFKSLNPKMKVIDLADKVTKIQMQDKHECEADDAHHSDHDEHKHQGEDPHIWTAPSNVKTIARNIYNALKKIDPVNADYYIRNLNIFLASIDETDRLIIDILSPIEDGEKFMVFHPSWGYFAKAYNQEKIAVEVEGKYCLL